MLAAFVSLRVFTFELNCHQHHAEEYLQYITRASHLAPHLQFFTIDRYGHALRFKRVNANWVVCYEAEYPAT
jgi:hypothetical protein